MQSEDFNKKRCIIVGLFSAKRKDIDDEMASMKNNLSKRGATILGTIIQRRGISRSSKKGGVKQMDAPLNAATVIGPGKVEELCQLVAEQEANTVIFYNDLTCAQISRLQEATGCDVFTIKQ